MAALAEAEKEYRPFLEARDAAYEKLILAQADYQTAYDQQQAKLAAEQAKAEQSKTEEAKPKALVQTGDSGTQALGIAAALSGTALGALIVSRRKLAHRKH